MSPRGPSLRTRITLVTIGVALLAVVVTGAVSVQLVRQSSVDEARRELAGQAVLLSKVGPEVTVAELSTRFGAAVGDAEIGTVSASGALSGSATLLRAGQVARLEAGARISSTVNSPSGLMLVEARPRKGGGDVVLALPRDTVDQAARASTTRLALALAIGLVVAIIAGALLSRWISAPLVRAARAARRMAAGERGIRLGGSQPSEVAAVGDALTALDVALTSSEGRQREFLLSISHELRTPLTALHGYAEALADGVVPTDQTAAVGRTLVAETDRLNRFVGDLLELARLEADDFSITAERVDIGALLESVRQAWGARATALGIALEVTGTHPQVTSDPQRLRQVVDGLVENALRVSPSGSAVRLAATAFGAGACIEVRDGGPGLTAEDAAVAFDRGVLRDRYRNARPVGTGLGLSIAARLTARLGGTITAGSASGGGALFTVVLPPVSPVPAR